MPHCTGRKSHYCSYYRTGLKNNTVGFFKDWEKQIAAFLCILACVYVECSLISGLIFFPLEEVTCCQSFSLEKQPPKLESCPSKIIYCSRYAALIRFIFQSLFFGWLLFCSHLTSTDGDGGWEEVSSVASLSGTYNATTLQCILMSWKVIMLSFLNTFFWRVESESSFLTSVSAFKPTRISQKSSKCSDKMMN